MDSLREFAWELAGWVLFLIVLVAIISVVFTRIMVILFPRWTLKVARMVEPSSFRWFRKITANAARTAAGRNNKALNT